MMCVLTNPGNLNRTEFDGASNFPSAIHRSVACHSALVSSAVVSPFTTSDKFVAVSVVVLAFVPSVSATSKLTRRCPEFGTLQFALVGQDTPVTVTWKSGPRSRPSKGVVGDPRELDKTITCPFGFRCQDVAPAGSAAVNEPTTARTVANRPTRRREERGNRRTVGKC